MLGNLARSWIVIAALAASLPSLAAAQVVYENDFELDDGGFVPFLGADWEHGVPSGASPAAHSGSKCWGTKLDGTIASSTNWMSVTIDTSAADGADGLLISWWQYLGDESPYYGVVVLATSTPGTSHVFGRNVFPGAYAHPHVGWRRIETYVGPEFIQDSFEFKIRYVAPVSGTVGMYVDDLRIEEAHKIVISTTDFETDDGGFSFDPAGWGWGDIPTTCPYPIVPSSGTKILGTAIDPGCGYGSNLDVVKTSPVLDLSPYANRREVYVSWTRSIEVETADALIHDVSYDGGVTWELLTGVHQGGVAYWQSSTFTRYGVVFDPAATPSVQLRFRFVSDGIETENGVYMDDFEIAVPEVVPGTGANPAGSLTVDADFELGATVTATIDDPAQSFPSGAAVFLALSGAGNSQLPTGKPTPGWGMHGGSGDLLVDLGPTLFALFAGPPWMPGSPSEIPMNIPNDVSLADVEFFLQGLMVHPGPPKNRGLTNGLFGRMGS